jgi:hypothetical protein
VINFDHLSRNMREDGKHALPGGALTKRELWESGKDVATGKLRLERKSGALFAIHVRYWYCRYCVLVLLSCKTLRSMGGCLFASRLSASTPRGCVIYNRYIHPRHVMPR